MLPSFIFAVAIVLLFTLLINTNGRVYEIEEYIDWGIWHSKYENLTPTPIPTPVATPYIPATSVPATLITSSQTPEITQTPEQTLYETIDTPVPSDETYEPLTIDRELDVDDLVIVGLKYGMTEKEVRSMYGAPLYYSQWDRGSV